MTAKRRPWGHVAGHARAASPESERVSLLAGLRAELASRGIRLKKRLGQSFMIDPNLARAVARLSGAAGGRLVLEIGAGAGHLTDALLELGARVVAVEIDRGLAAMLRGRFAGDERIRLVEGDALAKGDALSPEVREAIREELGAGGSGSFVVASNLPYNIAATFLIALAWSGLPWSGGAVTIQREVAERLAAGPGSKAYGASSVLWRLPARGRIERVIGRDVFWPRPEVDSGLFVIEPRHATEITEDTEDSGNRGLGALCDLCGGAGFPAFVKALFSQRRKVLRKSVTYAGAVGPEEAEAALAEAGLDPHARVEDAAPEAILALFREVKTTKG